MAAQLLSTRHLVNGDVTRSVPLDTAGRQRCRELAGSVRWLRDITTCVTSEFPRTRETAERLANPAIVPYGECSLACEPASHYLDPAWS